MHVSLCEEALWVAMLHGLRRACCEQKGMLELCIGFFKDAWTDIKHKPVCMLVEEHFGCSRWLGEFWTWRAPGNSRLT